MVGISFMGFSKGNPSLITQWENNTVLTEFEKAVGSLAQGNNMKLL